MTVYSFHLAQLPLSSSARALVRPLAAQGLLHSEAFAHMELGSPVFSPRRAQLSRLALFAVWEDSAALEAFLQRHPLGQRLSRGWHVRLHYLRRWGSLAALGELPLRAEPSLEEEPVVAVTIARMRLVEVPRFLRWGRPVERLVRDHPGATLALAAMRPPHTICTFSIWKSVRAMTDMVHGKSAGVPAAERHAVAMRERSRRDFHHEFITLRFRPLSEQGQWGGRGAFVPPPLQGA